VSHRWIEYCDLKNNVIYDYITLGHSNLEPLPCKVPFANKN